MSAVLNRKNQQLQDPPFARFLFADTRAAWFWLLVRVWLGWEWIDASLHKINNPAWVQTGEAVKGFWTNAVAIPEVGRPPITFEWYRSFIQLLLDNEAYTYMGPLIAYGELLIGIGLILGAFTAIAAFFGALLNWNFMMAGTASSNPLLFVLAVGLILAWKVAGYVGADYYLLRFLGTPWRGKPAERTVILVPEAAAAD
ncbi:MAG: DoxX family membrane protein [Caldilineaceae bacterium]